MEKSGSIWNLIDAKVQSDVRVWLVFNDAHHMIVYVNQEMSMNLAIECCTLTPLVDCVMSTLANHEFIRHSQF